jgi:hypothetical protein
MKHIIKEVLLQEAKKKKGDRCTRIAKRKYDVWPSAYASGAVVKCRQGKIWKNEDLEYDLDTLIENTEYEDLTKMPNIGDIYNNVIVKTQSGTEKRTVKVVSVYPKEREVLVRTDVGGDAIVGFDDLINESKKDFSKEKEKGLHGWFERRGGKGKPKGWVDCNTCRDGKCKPCGREEGEDRKKPRCRPTPSQCKGYKRPDER